MYTKYGDFNVTFFKWFYFRNSFDTLEIHILWFEYTYYKKGN